MRSYSSESRGLRQFVREATQLARGRATQIPVQVRGNLEHLRELEELADHTLGLRLEHLHVLDVGAGQLRTQMIYFARRNTVTGIDTDVVVDGFDLPGYVQMLLTNGPKRLIKTLGRKALGVDRRYQRELARQLGVPRVTCPKPLVMDAGHMAFPDQTFEFVYSIVVFQSLAQPAGVLDEMVRVLKPGGGVYFDFILYTGPTGGLDVRHLGRGEAVLPPWAHLRPAYAPLVQPNAYLNRLRLPEWRIMIDERMPGATLHLIEPEDPALRDEAASLHERELRYFTLEELLTSKVVVLWRKPCETGV
jgi:SAM-dependent methyltransferase